MLKTLSLLALFGVAVLGAQDTSVVVADYGVDCSFPIHSKDLRCGDRLGDRKKVYEEFMQGCRDFYGKRGRMCDSSEEGRIEMSIRQPRSMVNYTSMGFKKIRAPQRTMDLLLSHWYRNKDDKKKENWGAGNIYVNHWESPTYMVSVDDAGLRGGGSAHHRGVDWYGAEANFSVWNPCLH
jgi:prolyl 4-hydroxylase